MNQEKTVDFSDPAHSSKKCFMWKKNRRFSLFGQGERVKNEENAAYALYSQSLNHDRI